MDPRSEQDLVRRLQLRDERAFVEFVRVFQDKVYGLVFRMLGSHSEAEDVAQEVFVTVFKSIDSFRGDSKLGTWLFRIAANQCKNRIKYLNRRAHKTTSELNESSEAAMQGAQPSSLLQGHASPAEALEGVQLSAILQRAIGKLDEDHRLLLVLRDVEELSYEEIMQVTGLPEGTVKSRLHRARQVLKEEITRNTK